MNADLPPVHHTFELGAEITEVQQRFLDEHGFLHFSGVLSLEEVALAHAALMRRESRGSHQRTDHTERDDEQFLKHSMAYFDPAAPSTPRIDYKPVTITKWPPGKRTYGADSGLKARGGQEKSK